MPPLSFSLFSLLGIPIILILDLQDILERFYNFSSTTSLFFFPFCFYFLGDAFNFIFQSFYWVFNFCHHSFHFQDYIFASWMLTFIASSSLFHGDNTFYKLPDDINDREFFFFKFSYSCISSKLFFIPFLLISMFKVRGLLQFSGDP